MYTTICSSCTLPGSLLYLPIGADSVPTGAEGVLAAIRLYTVAATGQISVQEMQL